MIAYNYSYIKKPLRPSSGDDIASDVTFNPKTDTFKSDAYGTFADNPTDPMQLTNGQAARAVQV